MTTPHIDDGGRHIEKLDGRLGDLQGSFAGLGEGDDFEELFRIIHSPGWTTWPEIFLVNALIDAVERAVEDALRLRAALVEGARAIGKAASEPA